MRAGLLREIITFAALQNITSPSGAVKQEYADVLTVKAEKRKITSVNTDIDAKEEFTGNTVVFRTRAYPVINERMRVKWQGRVYNIQLLDRQLDNTYLIICTKVNKS